MKRLTSAVLLLVVGFYLAAFGMLSMLSDPDRAHESMQSDGMERVAIIFFTDEAAAMSRRIDKGIELLSSGNASLLVMAGGWRPGRQGFHGAEAMKAIAMARGSNPRQLLVAGGSNDSWSNLQEAVAKIVSSGRASRELVLVSDRLHIQRLRIVAALQGVHLASTHAATTEPKTKAYRIHHEILAYLSLALPRWFVEHVLNRTRYA